MSNRIVTEPPEVHNSNTLINCHTISAFKRVLYRMHSVLNERLTSTFAGCLRTFTSAARFVFV